MTDHSGSTPTGPSRPDASTWRSWGLDPTWSRTVTVEGAGGAHAWHLLDTGPGEPDGRTIVCVHGNPTWAYAWATFLRRLAPRHRVIAVDQLGMGFSDRPGRRDYATRVADLGDLLASDDLWAGDEPDRFVIAAHDWGGAISMGWAVDHVDRLDAMVLCNTGIAVPDGRAAPRLIRLAAAPWLRRTVCATTPTFVEGTLRLSGDALDAADRAAFRAPYRTAEHRQAIADFVGDVPLTSPHPSEHALATVASRLGELDVPVLLAWGTADPVFDDDFAADLARRLPATTLHRFPTANHLVMAEADVAGVAGRWLDQLDRPAADTPSDATGAASRPLWAAVHERAASSPESTALVDMASERSATWAELARLVDGLAATLRAQGLAPGDRVGMLTPPSVTQIALMYAVWRAGGVTVLADRGLGLRGLGRAVRSARVRWTVGPRAAAVASRTLRWAPHATHLDVDALVAAATDAHLADGELEVPAAQDEAAVLFTSGATGPAKGVRYLHGQLAAQRDALERTYSIVPDDRLVAAFAPFALYGPALGIGTALPDCDVTAPGSLTAEALGAAVERIDATLVFASPAALSNVVATSDPSTSVMPGVRTLMSAGAPVPSELLHSMARLVPSATLHTPYGMTETLPVADVELSTIDAAERATPAAGVCVGRPADGVDVRVVPLAFDAMAGVPEELATGRTGELLVRAPWRSDGYDGLWDTQRQARPGDGWHRTGDVGHVDAAGLLWVEGRMVHVMHTLDGPITSVPIERAVEAAGIDGVRSGRVAAVGIGPVGVQQVVVVVEHDVRRGGLADPALASAVRAAVSCPVAAVLVTKQLPVDIRHNAKIDRAEVAAWAGSLLAGAEVASA